MVMQPNELITGEDVVPYPHRRLIREDISTYVLVNPAKPYAWAIVSQQVRRWLCIAVGEMPDAANADVVTAFLAERHGNGGDRLPASRFAVTRPSSLDIHVLRTSGDPLTYCNVLASAPYKYKRGLYFQHCLACAATYQAENYGRHPLEEG